MVSVLEDAIARARRQIVRDEAPIRQRLHRAYRDALEALSSDLETVTTMIAEARHAGTPVSPDWLRRQDRYRQLIAHVEIEYARFAELGVRLLRDGQVAAVSGGAHTAPELLRAAGITTFGVTVNVPAVEQLVSALQPGSPVREVLEAYGPHVARIVNDELVAGIIEGRSPREIVRAIRQRAISGTNRARLESLVRTEMLRAFRGSLYEQMVAHKRPGDKWRRTAAKDTRTCLACLATDGELSDDVPTRFHIRCRCIFHLVPKGSAIPYERGVDWFARQSETTQLLMMPSVEAFNAYRRGDVTLMDFVGVKRSRVWGASIYQRSGRDAIARAKVRAA